MRDTQAKQSARARVRPWSYDEETVLLIHGQNEPFRHTDRNTLTKVAEPTPNPYSLPGARGS